MIKALMNKELPVIPDEIHRAIENSAVSATEFENKNDILQDESLQREVGIAKMPDGTFLVSMVCPMPGITAEMIRWWFWWHPQADERYKVWFPGEHKGIGYPEKQRAYFNSSSCPEFRNNTHYPLEKIGKALLPLRIDFVTPEQFGFSKGIMEEKGIPVIVCGHVGAFRGLVMHTQMAHIFKETDEGLFLISRFWLGKTMKSRLLGKMIITEKLAKDMARHCCIEYRNLSEILPTLYKEYNI